MLSLEHILGLMNSDWRNKDNIGYNGTSVEKLAQRFKHGQFTGQAYFAIVFSRFKTAIEPLEFRKFIADFDVEEIKEYDSRLAFNVAANYARSQAFYDYLHSKEDMREVMEKFLEFLSGCPNNIMRGGRMDKRYLGRLAANLVKEGLEEIYVHESIARAMTRKGSVIGIDKRFFHGKKYSDFTVNERDIGYPREEHMRRRFNMKYVTAVHFFTEEEKDDFKRLLAQ